MKFGVGLPTGMEGLINPIPFFEPRQFLEAAKLAEQLGYDSVWGNDHYAPQNYVRREYAAVPNFYEVLSVLAGVAAVTERVEIGTSVLVLPMRDIVTLARQTATIDQLSAGRLLLGVGIGAYPEEFHAARPDLAGGRRGEMLDEGLELLNRLLTEPTVTHHGKYYQVESLDMAPKGCADPVRVLVGGHQLRGIDRAIRHGSGWIPLIGPKDLSGVVRTPVISSLVELRGKITQLMALWQENRREGQPDILIPFPDAINLDGTDLTTNAAQYRDTLSELSAMGVTWVFVPGLGNNPDNSAVVHYLETVGRQLISA